MRLLAVALCFTAAGADSQPKDGQELHQPELLEPTPQLSVADDLVELHRGEGGGGFLATIGASPTDAAEDTIGNAGIPALMDAPHQPAAEEGPAAAAATAAATPQRRWELTDYTGRPLNETSAALDQRCQQAVNEVLEREAAQTAPPLYSDPLQGVQLAPRNASGGAVRIVYFVGVGPRPQAHLVISRLLYALWSAAHLFLLHLDVKAVGDAVTECMRLDATYTNVHVMRTRRLVQWGMFSMVSNYLDGIRSVLDAARAGNFDFDFFINLSDADLSLRTDTEMRAFLARVGPRAMVNVHEGGGPVLEEANAFIDAHTIIECGGYGFVAVNKTHLSFPMTAGCCIGRSGPAAFGELPVGTHPRMTETARPVHTGSQWAVLPFAFCAWLLDSAEAATLLIAFERRLVPDESLLQTAVMHSPFKARLLNHNLRWIDWPHQHGDAQEYWNRVGKGGRAFVGGPQVLNSSELAPVLASPYMFARKVDLDIDPQVLVLWDRWMARKLAGEAAHPAQAPIGHSPGDPMLSIRFRAPGMRDLAAEATLAMRPRRRVARVTFADGSACGCGDGCWLLEGGCCDGADDWRRAKRRRGGGGGGAGGGGEAEDNLLTPLERACAHSARPPTSVQGEEAPPCPEPNASLTVSKPGGRKLVLSWVSRAPHPVRLFVLDYAGNELAMATLKRSEDSLAYNSNEHVVWRARASNGELLAEYLPQGAEGQTVVVEACRFRHLGAAATFMPGFDPSRGLQLGDGPLVPQRQRTRAHHPHLVPNP